MHLHRRRLAMHPMMRNALLLRALLAAPLIFATLLSAAPAAAGGFYLAPRGVRPISRGGAYVAGVDDLHANWYNPAGLAYAGDQLMLDANLTLFEATFARVDSGGTELPAVRGYHPYLPIPTVGGSFSIDEIPDLTFSVVMGAPNSALMEWPQDPGTAQRYSLLSLQGSLLLSISAAAAWRPIEEFTIGLAAHVLVGSFNATVALSACDGIICSFPEDPEYDAISNISLPTAYPFFVLGTIIDLDEVRIGASVSTPFNLEGSALIRVRPPPASAFSGAEVVNRRSGCNYSDPAASCRNETRANVQLEFPWIIRLGVEIRPVPELRLELAAVYETWSVQDAARIDPQDVWIQGALGGGLEYQVGPLDIPRNMNDTISVRLGGAYTIGDMVTARLGFAYENGAFSDQYLTPLTIDSDKILISGGAGIDISEEVSLDISVGYQWMAPRNVTNSAVPQPNPIRPPGSVTSTVYVGNGRYAMSAPFFGLGLRWRLDAGHIRGPGEGSPEEEETAPAGSSAGDDSSAEEPSAEPQAEPTSPEADDAATDDDSTPWYHRGRDQ